MEYLAQYDTQYSQIRREQQEGSSLTKVHVVVLTLYFVLVSISAVRSLVFIPSKYDSVLQIQVTRDLVNHPVRVC
jgi:hypothetical protein